MTSPAAVSGFAPGYMGDYYETAFDGEHVIAFWSDNRSGVHKAYVDRLPLRFQLTLNQRFSTGLPVGSIGRWTGSSFGQQINSGYWVNALIGSTETFQAEDDLLPNPQTNALEKFHRWIGLPDSRNHQTFTIDGNTDQITAGLLPTDPGVSIWVGLLDGAIAGSANTVMFRDPWYYDFQDAAFPGTWRSGGMEESVLRSRSTATTGFHPELTSVFSGGPFPYRGVFLNQGYPGWGPPYYTVGAPETQSIGGWESYFVDWHGNPDSVAFQHPENTTTGVVFKAPSATVSARYKAHLGSSTPAATAANNQRKIVTASNGVSHAVYESGESIWYTRSNGSGWTQEQALRLFTNAKYPAIAWGYVAPFVQIHVVWQESTYVPYVGWRKRVWYLRSTDAGTTWENPVALCGGSYGDVWTSGDVDPLPVVATNGGSSAVVIWRKHDNYGSGFACLADPWNSGWSIQNVPATDGTTETPALVGADGWKLAYGKDAGKILYREFTVNSNGAFSFTSPEDLTAGYT